MAITTKRAIAQKGFTLIELMITVAIVGILASVAFPAYEDYVIRSQVAEGYTLAEGAKTAVIESYASNGDLGKITSNADVNYAGAKGKYVLSVVVGPNGVISSTFGANANVKVAGASIVLTPTESATGTLIWACSYTAPVVGKYVPTSCK
ncbi:pilin [Burkholderia cepacia]|uniref:pilin n=1 Tax=Burkholderia cepacia TaxID=292 RepID=UPI001CF0E1ED|nr:pilin [Burkholderia cepacia]MCA8354221.1 pilin [Burkholderia cepacia]